MKNDRQAHIVEQLWQQRRAEEETRNQARMAQWRHKFWLRYGFLPTLPMRPRATDERHGNSNVVKFPRYHLQCGCAKPRRLPDTP